MDTVVLLVFVAVYLGMILGEIPGLALERTGVALLGAIILLAVGRLSPSEAWAAVDVPTIGLLFGLMVVSAQFRLGGFYARVTRWIAASDSSPAALLAALIALCGVLSALLANDIVCLAVAPVLIEACDRRGLNPMPFLLALACSANAGSAATLIGNPQNMLIGQSLNLSFGRYLIDAGVPALLSLGAVWAIVQWQFRNRWHAAPRGIEVAVPAFSVWQTAKGLLVLTVLMAVFVMGEVPREVAALSAAGLLLMSRRMSSRDMLALVDWQLLVLFMGLFVVNRALAASGMLNEIFAAARAAGVDVAEPGWLFALTVVLSNLVSNVPAVMLLLPAATHPLAGPVLALASTLAGNLIIVGSIANIIVVDQAARLGVTISWRDHARVGVPVTAATLGVAAVWLWLRAGP